MSIRIWNNDGMIVTESIKILRGILVPVTFSSHIFHMDKPTGTTALAVKDRRPPNRNKARPNWWIVWCQLVLIERVPLCIIHWLILRSFNNHYWEFNWFCSVK